MNKSIVIAAGALLASVAATASAQVYYDRAYTYDPFPANRAEIRVGDECWNPRAGHFEGVRPGEVQNDLDFSRCRAQGGPYGERRDYRDYRDDRREYRDSGREYRDSGRRQECWNPRAGHYEGVRPGEQQSDLDFGRCRIAPY